MADLSPRRLADRWSGRLDALVLGGLRLVVAVAVVGLIAPPVAAAVAVGTLIYVPVPTADLPEERPQISAVPSEVFDSQGRQIAVFRGFDRSSDVPLSQIPDVVRDAVIAIEDQRFWQHQGVDFEGIGRAARINLEVGQVVQGGSTITQQYIKNIYLTNERTFERKLNEALLAVELEKRATKSAILHGYLTTSYFGEGAYGIGAAAEVYFAKDVRELDVSEAATLAGIIQAPTRLSPRNDLDAAEQRRRVVLTAMREQGYLDDADYEREMARHLWLPEQGAKPSPSVTVLAARPLKGAIDHPFFVDWVEAELLDQLGPDLLYRGGLTIETTIDPSLQAVAERSVAERLVGTEYPLEMALVSLEPSTGHVKAMVGGRDHEGSQVNLAIGGSTGFQPGSSFKPLVMAAAFEKGMDPDTRYAAPASWTVPGCSGQCTISNYDHANRGRITLRDAMRASVNTVFAQLVLDVGVADTVEFARRLGLDRLDPDAGYGASLALGAAESSTLEMASAYGTFANRGQRVPPTGVLRVIDADGNVLIDNTNQAGEQVVDPIVADNVTDVLVGVVESGTGQRAQLTDRPVAGKTGTGQSYRAAWFVGYTPSVSTAVWMGHADALRPLQNINGVGNVTGGSHPAIAWQQYMVAATAGTPVEPFPEPAEIVPPSQTSSDGDRRRAVVADQEEEITVAGPRSPRGGLASDCDGQSCEVRLIPAVPALPEPVQPEPPIALPEPEPTEGSSAAVTGSQSASSTPPAGQNPAAGSPTTTGPPGSTSAQEQ
ncbi:MAG: PBP1A family penicillin-binding protein [Actinomycetota bacterium]